MLKRFSVLPVLSLVLLSGCQSGNNALEKQNAEILVEMKKINARLDLLEKHAKQNADIRPELKKLNAKLDALDKRIKQARTVNQPHVLGPVPPDRNKLSRIKKLPPNPTDQQIIDYIRQIREATVGQTVFSNTDPQLSLYEQIGPGHLHLLLPYLNRDNYLTDMLPKLVGETDKELVRRSLKHYPVLIKSVVLKGWLKEMKKEIMALFKMPNVRVYEIRDCIPELVQTPDELKIVTDVYIHKPDGFFLLDNLKLLPCVDLRQLVNQAWAEAQKKYPTDEQAMIVRAQHAIKYGGPNVEAVKYLLKMLMSDQPGIQTFRKQIIIPFLTPWCDFPIYDPARLREWYDKNADRIVFDPATGKYVVKK
ncbi:MAG: hypothetical protein IJH79_11895 [Lentisphaeria bacterium]|nr:hypothetical protein [Lentisphaeria bacterium]